MMNSITEQPLLLRKRLINISLFLFYYEVLINEIIEPVSHFYNIGQKRNSKEYNSIIINRKVCKKKPNTLIASYLWLQKNNIIDEHDILLINKLTNVRNDFAHRILDSISGTELKISNESFFEIKRLIKKIKKQWVMFYADSYKVSNNIEKGIQPKTVLLDLIFDIATLDLDNLKEEDFILKK